MFSEKIYAEIERVMRKALEEMHGLKVTDAVTIIQGFMQLSRHPHGHVDAKLKAGIQHLLDLAKQENKRQLIDMIEALVQAMDQERAA